MGPNIWVRFMSSAGNPLPGPESSLSAERRYVQKVTQAFVQLAPLGGSGGLLLHFLLHQEWVQALLIFPVTLVAVIWAAYTESFMARLREIFTERGRHDADSLMQWLGKFDQALRWQISGFEATYLICQANACRDYVIEGYRHTEGLFIPMLEEVFVPLALSDGLSNRQHQTPLAPIFHQPRNTRHIPVMNRCATHRPEALSIWNFLSRVRKVPTYRRIVILAGGGYGKTTLLRHLTFSYATRSQLIRDYRAPRLVPVLLYLRKWQTLLTQPDAPNLPTLMTQYYIPDLPEGKRLKLPSRWADNLLRRGAALVMIDGFDEVAASQRAAVSQWISREMAEYPRSIFLLTSRPAGYQEYTAEKPQTTLYVNALDRCQQAQFIHRWYFCQERLARGGRTTPDVQCLAEREARTLITQIEQRPELEAMAQNPLMLNMIATFHRFYPGSQLPHKRPELYQDIHQMQLWDRPLAKRVEMLLPAADSQAVLRGVALEMVQSNSTWVSWSRLQTLVQQYLGQVTEIPIDSADFVKQMVQVSEILIEREPERYEFAHLSFQSYLAATQVKQLPQGETLLLQHWTQTWWRETILLYAAQVNPGRLIQLACRLGAEAATLAHACLLETTRSVSPDVVRQLQDLRYQKLATLLAAEHWREADAETYRLLLETLGKESEQMVTPDELQQFPCDDLERINQLWLYHSQGHFGLTVQKTIYLDCGGNLDNKYDENAWKQFCHQTGWMSAGEYVLVDFIFSLDAPVGHLPLGLLRIWFRWCAAGDSAREGWSLFSRIGDCQL
jgi:hypothetical protein